MVTDYKKVLEIVEARGARARLRGRARCAACAKVISDTGSVQVGLTGIDIKHEPRFQTTVQLASGNLDDLASGKTVMLFEQHAKKLGVKVGDPLTISAHTIRGASNTIDVQVVAIAKGVGLLSSPRTCTSPRACCGN